MSESREFKISLDNVWIEYDENGEVMGIEIWNAGEKVIMNTFGNFLK